VYYCLISIGEDVSVNGSNVACQNRINDDIKNLNDVNANQMGTFGAICFPAIVGNVNFHVTRTMLQVLQMKCFLERLSHKDPHDPILNFLDVCGPFSFKNISLGSIRSVCFPFLQRGKQ